MRENCTYGLMRGRWKPLSAVVRGKRVRRCVRERLQVSASALLYPLPVDFFIHNVFNYPTLAECYRTAALDGLNRLARA